ncbi:MAG: transcriptional regulator [Youngiibacter sp.]|nr:transcriptional regulator [Youngiibacter sp.]
MQGWIKLHRQLLENPIFQNEKLLKVFIWCLLKATHEEYDQLVGREIVTLKQGQFVTGRHKGSAELNLKPSTFWDYLSVLKSNNTIDIKSDNKQSVISIVNWGLYQSGNYNPDSKSDSESNIKHDSKSDTNKKKEDKNINIDDFDAHVESINEPDSLLKNDTLKNNHIPHFESMWSSYPKKTGKQSILKSASKLKALAKISIEEMQRAIDRYKKEVDRERSTGFQRQYKDGGTWFNGSYIDYLDSSYIDPGMQAKPKDKPIINDLSRW